MYTLKDSGVLHEVECGNNFGYILDNTSSFVITDYKVLQSQTSGIFVKCMKMLYNGKTELYYVTDEYRPMSSMLNGILPDNLVTIIINLFANVIEVRNNGFLSCQNIDLSWDKIYIDANTMKVKLVYLPINVKIFDGYAAFESELRSSLVKLINQEIITSNARLNQFVQDLSNGTLSLEDVYNKSRGSGTSTIVAPQSENSAIGNKAKGSISMVAMNVPKYFDIKIDRAEMLIGKKADIVDAVIPFSKMISRKHCKIVRKNEVYYISDEGSANGTYVNSVRLSVNQPYQINRGDIIRLADIDFQIV